MKVVHIDEFGPAENLSIRDSADPDEPTGNEVLVRVRAAALNRADLLQRQGLYPAPAGYPERIPGLEFAGEVAAVGPDVAEYAVGDRVFGITAGGAQSEYLKTDAGLLAVIPENLGFTEAAAVPEAFITAHDAIVTQCGLAEGETLLIHAVGSGVGLAALQTAKALRNSRVIGTSRTPEKIKGCRQFGLDLGISGDEFAPAVRDATDGKGVDVVLDLVGARFFGENLKSLAIKGRLILVGLVGGRKAEFDLGAALSKRLTIIGTVLRSRTTQEKAAATAAFARDVLPLIRSGAVVPNVDRVFSVRDVIDAHRYLESNQSFGKVILEF